MTSRTQAGIDGSNFIEIQQEKWRIKKRGKNESNL